MINKLDSFIQKHSNVYLLISMIYVIIMSSILLGGVLVEDIRFIVIGFIMIFLACIWLKHSIR